MDLESQSAAASNQHLTCKLGSWPRLDQPAAARPWGCVYIRSKWDRASLAASQRGWWVWRDVVALGRAAVLGGVLAEVVEAALARAVDQLSWSYTASIRRASASRCVGNARSVLPSRAAAYAAVPSTSIVLLPTADVCVATYGPTMAQPSIAHPCARRVAGARVTQKRLPPTRRISSKSRSEYTLFPGFSVQC
jgi:hypothetical protein